MVLEYCELSDLFKENMKNTKNKTNFSETLKYKLALDIAEGMHFLQSLKPPM